MPPADPENPWFSMTLYNILCLIANAAHTIVVFRAGGGRPHGMNHSAETPRLYENGARVSARPRRLVEKPFYRAPLSYGMPSALGARVRLPVSTSTIMVTM